MTILYNCDGILNNRIQIMLQLGLFFVRKRVNVRFVLSMLFGKMLRFQFMQVGPLSAK